MTNACFNTVIFNDFIFLGSLIKMISGIVSQTNDFPTPSEIAYAIRRNFGGLQGLDPVQEFAEYVPEMEGYQVMTIRNRFRSKQS